MKSAACVEARTPTLPPFLAGDAGMEHVLLAGEGASEYADVLGPEQIERVPQDYFDTEGRLRALRSVQAQEAAVDQITPVVLDHEFPVDVRFSISDFFLL